MCKASPFRRLERLFAEFAGCCQHLSADDQLAEWCKEAQTACPETEPSVETLGEAVALFAEKRGNVLLRTIYTTLHLPPAILSKQFGTCGGLLVPTMADEQVLAWRIATEIGIVGPAEHPRGILEVALRGFLRGRARRDNTTPPRRSPLRAELSDAHLARIRKSIALDRNIHKIASARFHDDLYTLRSNGHSQQDISFGDDERMKTVQDDTNVGQAMPASRLFSAVSVKNYY